MSTALTRLERIAASLDPRVIAEIRAMDAARAAAAQPWFIAGVSDGMGLHTAIAAIEAGVLKRGLGVYWEPSHLLENDGQGRPVSPIHRARVENAAALVAFAERRGVSFQTVFANCIIAPERDLKGQPKGDVAPLPEAILNALGAPNADLIFINSVAFGKWMCPREGMEPRTAPMLGFDGTLSFASTKPFHARGYQETLDTMGRNHAWMLDALQAQGYLGPKSLSAFFTWAGGSQRVSSLEGIYGKGALGDAKLIAEAEIARRRIEEAGKFGKHAVVRLPAFLSAALMGIPGGGFFGMLSRRILEQNQCFEGMPELAGRMVREFFGAEWLAENPISQIELDHAECLYLDTINAAVADGTARLGRLASEPGQVLDAAAVSREFSDLFPPNFEALLRGMTPEAPLEVSTMTTTAEALRRGLPEVFAAGKTTVVWGKPATGALRCQISTYFDGTVVEAFSGDTWVATAASTETFSAIRPEDLGAAQGVAALSLDALPAYYQGLLGAATAVSFEWSATRPAKALMYLQETEKATSVTWVADARPCGRVVMAR